jgi:GH24 family phage-related lysozyme (muramidase)
VPTDKKISSSALSTLRKHEGSIPYVYDDGDGTWPKARIGSFSTKGYPTIGVGHLIRASEYDKYAPYLASGGKELSDRQIEDLLRSDVERVSEGPLRNQINVPITQSMWDALVIQAFNTGPHASSVKATVKAINEGDFDKAQAALLSGPTSSKGKYLPALAKRRQSEASLFLQDGYPTFFHGIPTAAYLGVSIGLCSLVLALAVKRKRQR